VTHAMSRIEVPVTRAMSRIEEPVTHAMSRIEEPVTHAMSRIEVPVTHAESSERERVDTEPRIFFCPGMLPLRATPSLQVHGEAVLGSPESRPKIKPPQVSTRRLRTRADMPILPSTLFPPAPRTLHP